MNADNKIGTNNEYMQQLLNNLKCPKYKMTKVENVNYEKTHLLNFFVEYNRCSNSKFTNFERKKDFFNLSIRPGLNISSLSIQNFSSNSLGIDFGYNFAFRFGIEAEFIFPFNSNKWAIIIEPTYQYFKTKKKLNSIQSVKVDYKSIELPLGVRYYIFLNKRSKIFVNSSYIFDFVINSGIDYNYRSDLEIKTRSNFAFGLGYKYNDRYSTELRYQTSREILSQYTLWISNYNTLSVIFGYSFF